MTKRRIITIILIVIAVLVLVLSISWLLTRKKAENKGVPPPTFKSFLGLGGETSNTIDGVGPEGEVSSVFTGGTPGSEAGGTGTNPENSSNNFDDGSGASAEEDTRVSTFTDGTTTPAGQNLDGSGRGSSGSATGGGSVGSGGGIGASGTGSASGTGFAGERGSTGTGGGSVGSGGGIGASGTGSASGTGVGGTGVAMPDCTDADLNITFTPEEQAKLQALQNRFYAVAQNLHTDADTATELANFSGFKTKANDLKDLLNYCQSVSKKVDSMNPAYAKRVPTPFWYEPKEIRQNNFRWLAFNQVTQTLSTDELLGTGVPLGYMSEPGQVGGIQEKSARKDNGIRSLEQVLRLNLW